jgi:hypothetical protein
MALTGARDLAGITSDLLIAQPAGQPRACRARSNGSRSNRNRLRTIRPSRVPARSSAVVPKGELLTFSCR